MKKLWTRFRKRWRLFWYGWEPPTHGPAVVELYENTLRKEREKK